MSGDRKRDLSQSSILVQYASGHRPRCLSREKRAFVGPTGSAPNSAVLRIPNVVLVFEHCNPGCIGARRL